MKWIEIKNKPMDVLEKDLADAKSKLVDFKFKVQSGALKQVHEIGKVKKEIAMILTKMHQLKHNNKPQKSEK
ncbi:50S ribosomal protein L29 [bacterium]|jgi:ribosomal protein L29|nr:50S ribosomal protein L29 [bacterium]MDP6571302.1 50S ribosomal protein L29 [Patescibacteria group bacterium]|tara:strand:- start:5371 stop:5586 length:216 start_codon:yes stop_codon:yes gene_type:complete